jgi:hypothetical protein
LRDIFLERWLQLLQVAKSARGGGDGIHLLAYQFRIVGQAVSILAGIFYLKIVSQSPGLGVEDRTLVLLVIVR